MESWNDDPQQGDNEKIPELDDGQIESGFTCKDWVEQC